ncbi:MAG TPA: murein L,D-transpeptidase [Syntrophaceae bacterium]|nr:murein L,D-transpeptidase [Syntrophaceae bacterium]
MLYRIRSSCTHMINFFNHFLPVFTSILLIARPSAGASVQEICKARNIPLINASMVIVKSKYRLFFYLDGKYIKTYPIVLGKNPNGPKLYEGDNCTPEGIYRVKAKFDHERWSKFILLDYPNQEDLMRYGMALKRGEIPEKNGGYASIGGGVGIHGTPSRALNQAGKNWTSGCISLLNEDINEIFPYVKKGTVVYILP